MTLFIVTNWRYKAEELILGLFYFDGETAISSILRRLRGKAYKIHKKSRVSLSIFPILKYTLISI